METIARSICNASKMGSTAVTEIAQADLELADLAEAEAADGERPSAGRRRQELSWGWLAVALLVAQALSGLVLMFHYRPAVASAFLDLVDLREVSRFGFMRTLHRWGSHAVVLLLWLHLLKAALRGHYASPRHRNWTVGVVLMLLTLLLATTGYLLPWDQDAFWSLAVVVPMADGAAAAEARLLRFYVAHCVVLPVLVAALTVYHLRRTRRDRATDQGSEL